MLEGRRTFQKRSPHAGSWATVCGTDMKVTIQEKFARYQGGFAATAVYLSTDELPNALRIQP